MTKNVEDGDFRERKAVKANTDVIETSHSNETCHAVALTIPIAKAIEIHRSGLSVKCGRSVVGIGRSVCPNQVANLTKSVVAYAFQEHQMLRSAKWSVRFAMPNDFLGEAFPDKRYPPQLVSVCGIDVYRFG